MKSKPSKVCVVCGRRFDWRKKWERNWDEVRYCSKACRSTGISSADTQLETAILELLSQRGRQKTICPSEAARLIAGASSAGEPSEESWRKLMEPARAAARRLVESGEVEITQRGAVVDPSTAKGPIRIRTTR